MINNPIVYVVTREVKYECTTIEAIYQNYHRALGHANAAYITRPATDIGYRISRYEVDGIGDGVTEQWFPWSDADQESK